jgi:hypothetical protein
MVKVTFITYKKVVLKFFLMLNFYLFFYLEQQSIILLWIDVNLHRPLWLNVFLYCPLLFILLHLLLRVIFQNTPSFLIKFYDDIKYFFQNGIVITES